MLRVRLVKLLVGYWLVLFVVLVVVGVRSWADSEWPRSWSRLPGARFTRRPTSEADRRPKS
jgi:hypothetical protein